MVLIRTDSDLRKGSDRFTHLYLRSHVPLWSFVVTALVHVARIEILILVSTKVFKMVSSRDQESMVI